MRQQAGSGERLHSEVSAGLAAGRAIQEFSQ
jgi:hypothetical protein